MVNCQWIRLNLSAYIDGEMAPEQASDLKGHLESCVSCRAAYMEMKQAWDLLDLLEESSPSEGLRKRIMRLVAHRNIKRWSMMSASAAAVLLIALSLVILYSERGREKASMQVVLSESASVVSERDLPEKEREEIIANLHLLQEKDFYDTLDTLKKIDELPLMGDDKNEGDQKSSLALTVT